MQQRNLSKALRLKVTRCSQRKEHELDFRGLRLAFASVLVFAFALAACNSAANTERASDVSAPAATEAPVAETMASTTAVTASATSAVTTTTAITGTTVETNTASSATDRASGARTFTLTQAGTEARFSLYELLMGQDKTVVGVTSLVEGSLTVDPANPSSTVISPIRIDASDLTTDSDRRNGAIRRFVLQSNQAAYQYITFTPTAIAGLPAAVNVGDTFSFTVQGDLTIRDVTYPETFELTVTVNSENELVGLGKTTIMRGNYGLTIPSVPSVANVGEEVQLEIEFTAVATE